MILELLLTLVVAQPNASPVVRELTEIEQRLGSTSKQGNCTGWGALVAPEWSVIHLTGETMTRAQALEMCQWLSINSKDSYAGRSVADVKLRYRGGLDALAVIAPGHRRPTARVVRAPVHRR